MTDRFFTTDKKDRLSFKQVTGQSTGFITDQFSEPVPKLSSRNRTPTLLSNSTAKFCLRFALISTGWRSFTPKRKIHFRLTQKKNSNHHRLFIFQEKFCTFQFQFCCWSRPMKHKKFRKLLRSCYSAGPVLFDRILSIFLVSLFYVGS